MSLSKTAVKNAILTVFNTTIENTNPEESRESAAEALAEIICDAVKAGVESAQYDTGLVSPAGTSGGPVTGSIDLTVTIAP